MNDVQASEAVLLACGPFTLRRSPAAQPSMLHVSWCTHPHNSQAAGIKQQDYVKLKISTDICQACQRTWLH